jgi:tRNA G18 (ribose-2'-O)-methylase SpoU
MRADKFMPVYWTSAVAVLDAARATGHQVLALDESGDHAPWQLDLTGPRIFVVGGENGGIPPEVLARCDAAIRVPMQASSCYNLQAAVGSRVHCADLAGT